MKSFLNPIMRSDAGSLALTNVRSNRVVASTLLTAFDSASRRRGLLKHDSLSEGSALIIAPSSAVHTFFMRFPIDLAFVSREGRVLKLCAGVRPWRISAAWRAFAVIELPVGALNRSDTRTGDMLHIAGIGKDSLQPDGSAGQGQTKRR
jgi:uncharacterized membrane protein (UPF0127 family)